MPRDLTDRQAAVSGGHTVLPQPDWRKLAPPVRRQARKARKLVERGPSRAFWWSVLVLQGSFWGGVFWWFR